MIHAAGWLGGITQGHAGGWGAGQSWLGLFPLLGALGAYRRAVPGRLLFLLRRKAAAPPPPAALTAPKGPKSGAHASTAQPPSPQHRPAF